MLRILQLERSNTKKHLLGRLFFIKVADKSVDNFTLASTHITGISQNFSTVSSQTMTEKSKPELLWKTVGL